MRKIKDFPDYKISITGNVWSMKSRKWLKPANNKRGYLYISLRKDGKTYTKTIHNLVAKAFIPNPDNKPQINHIDGNKTNNLVNNLEWVTAKENNQHAWDIGLKENARKASSEIGKITGKVTIKKAIESRKKKVICLETGQIFNSATEASRYLGLRDRAVTASIRRNSKAGGYRWIYLSAR